MTIGIICLGIGGYMISQSNAVFEHVIRYDSDCENKQQAKPLPGSTVNKEDYTCTLAFDLEKDVRGPVYVYYQLENF